MEFLEALRIQTVLALTLAIVHSVLCLINKDRPINPFFSVLGLAVFTLIWFGIGIPFRMYTDLGLWGWYGYLR